MAAPKGNQFAVGNSGRAKQFASPEELQELINNYYQECKEDKVPLTIEGLCDVLDCERMTLLNYEKTEGYEEFFYTIKKAKLKVQRDKMERALSGKANAAFSIFDLVNNTDYENVQKVENTNRNIEIPEIKFKDTDGDK